MTIQVHFNNCDEIFKIFDQNLTAEDVVWKAISYKLPKLLPASVNLFSLKLGNFLYAEKDTMRSC